MKAGRLVWMVGGLVALALVSFAPGVRADDGYMEAEDDESCQDGPNRMYCPRERCSWCANQGRCFFDEKLKLCAVGGGECKDSPACLLYGRCTAGVSARDGRALCVANSDAGCAASAFCAAQGRCGKAAPGPAVPDDEEGSFTRDGWGCAATKTPMCAASKECQTDLRCVARKGRCEAKNQSACSRFEGCKKNGRCTYSEGSCEVETDKDCRRSEICKRFGACSVDGGSGHFPANCVAWGCQDHELCRRYGACGSGGREGCETDNPYEPVCPREQWVSVGIVAVTPSSTMPGAGGYVFDAAQLFDGDLTTSWQPAKSKTNGVGQRLVIKLAEPAEVIALEIANGFQRVDGQGDQFTLNSRVSRLYVELDENTRHLVVLSAERRGLTEIYLQNPLEPFSEVTLEIVDTARGTRWKDPAISEIKVFRCAE